MRPIRFILCILLMLPFSIFAQTTDVADQYYLEFVKYDQEGNKPEAYKNLNSAYKEYCSILDNSSIGSQQYIHAKNRLRTMYPNLRNGAIYNSQNGSQNNALIFAQAFIDLPLMSAFESELFEKDDYYPTLAYFAASGTYNIKDYNKAITYFREYLNTGDTKARQSVFTYMAKSCMNVNNLGLAKSIIDESLREFPTDYNVISMGINCCIDSDDSENLQKYVTRALAMRPNDQTLLNIQGKLYEENFDLRCNANICSICTTNQKSTL